MSNSLISLDQPGQPQKFILPVTNVKDNCLLIENEEAEKLYGDEHLVLITP